MKGKLLLIVLFALILAAISLSSLGCAPSGEPAQGILSEERGQYPDGRYRGTFHDRGIQQVGIQFFLEDNQLYDLSFRVKSYGGNDFLDPDNPDNEWAQEDVESLAQQYGQLLDWLEGRNIQEIGVLVDSPENAAEDVEGSGEVYEIDTWTAATMRGTKITSAIRDGLNRGPY